MLNTLETFNNDFYDSRKSYSYKTRFSCLQFSNKKISVEQNEKKNFKAKPLLNCQLHSFIVHLPKERFHLERMFLMLDSGSEL